MLSQSFQATIMLMKWAWISLKTMHKWTANSLSTQYLYLSIKNKLQMFWDFVEPLRIISIKTINHNKYTMWLSYTSSWHIPKGLYVLQQRYYTPILTAAFFRTAKKFCYQQIIEVYYLCTAEFCYYVEESNIMKILEPTCNYNYFSKIS